MKLEDLRDLAKKGIETPNRSPIPNGTYRPEVQELWDDIARAANRFHGASATTKTARALQASLQIVLETGIANGVLPCTKEEVDGLRVEVDGGSSIEVVWPPTVRKFFEEEERKWKERKS